MESISNENLAQKQISSDEVKQMIEQDAIYKKYLEIQNDKSFEKKCEKMIQILNDFSYGYKSVTENETKNYPIYYQRSINKEIERISSQFPKYIDVRGDGNCFYRSIMLSFLLQMFSPSEQRLFPEFQIKQILNFLKNVDNINNRLQKYRIQLPYSLDNIDISDLKDYFLCQICGLIQEFLNGQQQMFNSVIQVYEINPLFDFSCVIICRLMIFKSFLIHNQNTQLRQFRDQEVMNQIQQLLLNYGTQAEDMIIKLAAEAFNCNLIIQNLYYNSMDNITNQIIFQPLVIQQNQQYFAVPILYTNGHYMGLVDKNLLDRNKPIEIKGQIQSIMNQQQQQIILNQGEKQIKQNIDITKRQQEMQQIYEDQKIRWMQNLAKFTGHKNDGFCFIQYYSINNSFQSIEAHQQIYLKVHSIEILICSSCQEKIQNDKKQQEKNIEYFEIKNDIFHDLAVFKYKDFQR